MCGMERRDGRRKMQEAVAWQVFQRKYFMNLIFVPTHLASGNKRLPRIGVDYKVKISLSIAQFLRW